MQVLFDNINLQVDERDRIGLAENEQVKPTLIEDTEEDQLVGSPKRYSLSYLAQDSRFEFLPKIPSTMRYHVFDDLRRIEQTSSDGEPETAQCPGEAGFG